MTTTRLTGLVRLLLSGLRVLGLLEYKARRSLAAKGEKVAGLTKGLPKKATARPTTEAILQAFEGVTLSRLGDTCYLNATQRLADTASGPARIQPGYLFIVWFGIFQKYPFK